MYGPCSGRMLARCATSLRPSSCGRPHSRHSHLRPRVVLCLRMARHRLDRLVAYLRASWHVPEPLKCCSRVSGSCRGASRSLLVQSADGARLLELELSVRARRSSTRIAKRIHGEVNANHIIVHALVLSRNMRRVGLARFKLRFGIGRRARLLIG